MDFAHETKKRLPYVTVEPEKKQQPKLVGHGHPYSSLWDFIRQCDSIHPLLRKIEYP